MIDVTSFASEVADELNLSSSAHAEDVTGAVGLTSAAYGEDVAHAINNRDYTLRVLSYNIGHFNMGMDAGNICDIGANNPTTQAYPQFFNYATQLSRWLSRISGTNADVICMPEWNANFGYNSGTLVPTSATGIFSGYNVSAGEERVSSWWCNCLASKFTISNIQDIDLEHTSDAWVPYVRVGTATIEGKTVKIAVTHLNWNRSLSFYQSRQKEIKSLVKLFDADPYVILCGDFNTEGPYDNVDYAAGLQEYQPFIDGFTENGVTYNGGFTLANSMERQLKTYMATGSRPDQSQKPQYPFCYLDNVITKGFEMSNVQVIDDGYITDHCAVVADLTIIE